MTISRRELLAGAGTVAALGAGGTLNSPLSPSAPSPWRDDFAIPRGQAYLNSAYIHPLPLRTAAAVQGYLATRTLQRPRQRSGDSIAAEVKTAAGCRLLGNLAAMLIVGALAVRAYRVLAAATRPTRGGAV